MQCPEPRGDNEAARVHHVSCQCSGLASGGSGEPPIECGASEFSRHFTETDRGQQSWLVTFKARLQELGWTEGQRLHFATPVAEDVERMRISAAELVALAPDVMLSTTSTTARALLDATSTVPIVSAVIGDPLALGFTRSMHGQPAI